MKKITIKNVQVSENPDLDMISAILDKQDIYTIDTINWSEFDYKPEVRFSIAYSSRELFIKFYVTEDYVRAVHGESNQGVYQDSCVEFFVKPISEGPYLNFEFNAIGTCLMQKGLDRDSRKFIEPEHIATIRRSSSLGHKTFEEKTGKQSWNLVLAIPFILIFGEMEPELSGKIIRANFYKCGDKLTKPHYLSWNPIGTEHPDFHRPEFFGVMEFE